MRLAHSETTPWTPVPPLRGGTIEFKTLLEGHEGAPDNYQLLIANTDISFQSPRHRHNFDQLRYSLEGSTNFGPKRNLEQGDLAYFPEGTYYGPQVQQEVGQTSLAMVVQFGGPSGNGYMSRQQMQDGFNRLGALGKFEAGVFKRTAPAPDGRMNQDAYEAVWEFQNGRPVSYSKPRFLDPVHFREQNFDWQPVAGQPGVATKHIGSFTEKGIRVFFLQLQPGACHVLPPEDQIQLLFVKDGTGKLGAHDAWSRHSAVELAPGETAALEATTLTELMVLVLPRT
jgi:hypothetical protein